MIETASCWPLRRPVVGTVHVGRKRARATLGGIGGSWTTVAVGPGTSSSSGRRLDMPPCKVLDAGIRKKQLSHDAPGVKSSSLGMS